MEILTTCWGENLLLDWSLMDKVGKAISNRLLSTGLYQGSTKEDFENLLFDRINEDMAPYSSECWMDRNIDVFDALRRIKQYHIHLYEEVKIDLSDSDQVMEEYVRLIGLTMITNFSSYYGTLEKDTIIRNGEIHHILGCIGKYNRPAKGKPC